MPRRPRTPCPVAGCGELTDGGRCDDHKQQAEERRGSSSARGYGKHHRERFRPAVLERDICCVLCISHGKWTLATVADHWPLSRRELIERGLDPNDPRHGRGLCDACHNQSTARLQPGGFNQAS